MKLLFLQPPLGAWSTFGKHKAINVNHAQLAANVREWYPEIDIKVLDCRALDMDKKAMISAIQEISPDLIYMGDALQTTGVAAIVPRYKEAAEAIKAVMPSVKVCVGGFFIGANAPMILGKNPEFDYAIYGETERTLPELAHELSKDDPDIPSIKGLCWRDGDEIRVNEYRPLIENLDDLPLPAYDLFPMERYVGFGYVKNYAETYHSRGCPNGCAFCVGWTNYDPRGNRDWAHYRYRSGKRVVDEFELLNKKFGIKHIVMMDEDFNVERSRVEEFLSELLSRDLDVTYFMMGRAPYFLRDKDLLKDLRKSGLIYGLFGLEVTDRKTLKNIGKNVTLEEITELINIFRNNGIMSVVTWLVGLPEDDEGAIKGRFERIDRIDPDIGALQILTPLPGIPIYRKVEPYIEDWNLENWDFHHAVVRTKHLSREELGRLAAWSYREFYSRPGRVQRILYDERYHECARLVARCYIETASDFSRAAEKGERFV